MMLALMNEMQSKGGKARAEALSGEERKAIAKKAAAARWKDRPEKVEKPKESVVEVEVPEEELEVWRERAKAAGMTVEEWVVKMCGEKILPKISGGKEIFTTVPMGKNSDEVPLGCIQPKWFWAYLPVEKQEEYARGMREGRSGKVDRAEVVKKLRGEIATVKAEVQEKAIVGEEAPIF